MVVPRGSPAKNLCIVAGKPLLVYAIEAARQAKNVSRIIVSTEDDEIAAIARRTHAEIIARPRELSDDHATSESAVLHCLAILQQREKYQPDLVALVQCTSPLMDAQDLDGAIQKLHRSGADCCFTATPFHGFVWSEAQEGNMEGINHDGKKRKRRQDLPAQYLENGAVYVMRTVRFLSEKDRFCGKVVSHTMPQERSFEIDTPTDLTVVASLAVNRKIGASSKFPQPVDAVVF